MTTFLGIDFAPFKVPLHRRLETLAALKFVFSFVIMHTMATLLVLYVVFYTSYYWLALIYLCWLCYDWHTPSRGGRRAKWYRTWVLWRYFRDYFPAKLIKTHELDPQYNYVIAYHPHGIMGMGAFIHFGTEATGVSKLFPGITPYLMIMKILLNLPIVHDYYMLPGCCDVSRDSIEYILENSERGNACVILVGGAKESLESKPGTCLVLLKNRMGFCRMALKHGAHLVPVYSFGESDLYTQVDNPEGSKVRCVQNFMQKLMGFAIPFFHGRGIFNYNFGLLPHRHPINTVVGAPIPVKKIAEPTRDDLRNLHQIYCEKLKALFEEHKVNYEGYKDKELIYI
ncbi:2-acylglycerol O-acyltransferase 2-A-like [Saccoglossus kowalevskii]|uniref:Acyltransferase n=1 Tax=Saccoglossus kowalevskii TaxID=10224 RepID=A0ABM0MHU8_SACKO|nr:PREDICTED: 2-acylglycerol O-acyltransferase 2-A-like [Saccoglossus kowalevskii]